MTALQSRFEDGAARSFGGNGNLLRAGLVGQFGQPREKFEDFGAVMGEVAAAEDFRGSIEDHHSMALGAEIDTDKKAKRVCHFRDDLLG